MRYAIDSALHFVGKRLSQVRHVDRIQAAYRYHARSKSTARYEAFVPETLRASRSHGGRFFSRLYLDYYLPHRRPWAYRLLVAYRLVKAGERRRLLRLAAHRIGLGTVLRRR